LFLATASVCDGLSLFQKRDSAPSPFLRIPNSFIVAVPFLMSSTRHARKSREGISPPKSAAFFFARPLVPGCSPIPSPYFFSICPFFFVDKGASMTIHLQRLESFHPFFPLQNFFPPPWVLPRLVRLLPHIKTKISRNPGGDRFPEEIYFFSFLTSPLLAPRSSSLPRHREPSQNSRLPF